MDKPLNIALWEKDSGNALSHTKGLDADQIKALQQLKVGDRVILFRNKKEGETQPTFNLKLFTKPAEPDDGGL
jgi:hypothetical protein